MDKTKDSSYINGYMDGLLDSSIKNNLLFKIDCLHKEVLTIDEIKEIIEEVYKIK